VGDPLDQRAVALLRRLLPAQALQLELRQRQRVLAPLVDAELLRLRQDLPLRPVQRGERRHLGAQQLGRHRLEQVVDRARLVAAQDPALVGAVRGDEDDGDVAGARVLPHQARGLVPVHLGHVHVEQDERALVAQQEPQRLRAGARLHQLVPRPRQRRLERQQVRRPIVHQQDLHGLDTVHERSGGSAEMRP
jgi:hypothetical protein